jgi:hypothetical protein
MRAAMIALRSASYGASAAIAAATAGVNTSA